MKVRFLQPRQPTRAFESSWADSMLTLGVVSLAGAWLPGSWKSTAADELGKESRQPAGTEVVEARPARLDGDAHHLVINRPDLLPELSALRGVQRLRSTLEVFVGDAVDRLQRRLAANLQRLRVSRFTALVDGQRYVWAAFQCPDLR